MGQIGSDLAIVQWLSARAFAHSLAEREKHLHGAPCQARQYFFDAIKTVQVASNGDERQRKQQRQHQ